MLEAMHMKDVELKRNADALKLAQQKAINARLAQRIKKQNRDMLKEKSPELKAHQPIISSVTYSEYSGTGLAEKIQKANNSNDKKAKELEKKYQEAMEELDKDDQEAMEELQAELEDSKQKLRSEVAKGKHDLITNMTSEESDKLLADYEAQCDEMRQRQHQEELRRRRLLEMKLLARRRQRQRDIKDNLEAELKTHEDQNREVLAKARHNEVKKAELKLIQESFENSNEQDSITLVKSGTSHTFLTFYIISVILFALYYIGYIM